MIVNMDLLRESLAKAGTDDPSTRTAQERYVGVVQGELTRLNQTLLEMLDQVAPLSQKPERVDLGNLLRELGTLLAEQARRQRVELSMELNTPAVVLGRKDHLKQVLLNIAINALEAMPRGGRLSMQLTRESTTARVRCSDTGPGIPVEVREQIYQMGYSTKEAGTGTGLYLARMIVDQHGGAIRATNASGGGACFEIDLPSIGMDSESPPTARPDLGSRS
jgi:two-component system, sporulation sensor kinase D